MSEVKEAAMQIIQSLPEDCSFEDIHYRLYLWQKIQKGEQDIREGKVFTQEEAKRRLKAWAESLGLTRP